MVGFHTQEPHVLDALNETFTFYFEGATQEVQTENETV